MTDRESHRAAVEAGYASLAEYIEKWGENKMDIVERLNAYNPPHMVTDEMMQEIAIDIQDAKVEIERLREALRYYADPNRYESEWDNQFRRWVPNHDHGAKAFFALQQKESE